MTQSDVDRRKFLARLTGAAAVAGVSLAGGRAAVAQDAAGDAWLKEVKGTYRCLFDFPQAQERVPAAAHPQLPEHLCDGLQDRRRAGRRRRHVLRGGQPGEHPARVQ